MKLLQRSIVVAKRVPSVPPLSFDTTYGKKSTRRMSEKKQVRLSRKRVGKNYSCSEDDASTSSTLHSAEQSLPKSPTREQYESISEETSLDTSFSEANGKDQPAKEPGNKGQMPSSDIDADANRKITNEDFVREIATSIESEDIQFLIDTGFSIRTHLLDQIPKIESLAVILSRNLGTAHRLNIIKTIRVLARHVNIRGSSEVVSNIKKHMVDYSKLFYLKGKLEFMRQRLRAKEVVPECITEEH